MGIIGQRLSREWAGFDSPRVCVRLAVQWFKLSFISLVTDSAGKDKAPPPVRLRKQGRVAPESSVLDVSRISRVSLYKVCKSRRYKLKLVEVWIASSLPHQYPLQMACGPVQVGRGESGLLPDRTQGAGLSRRLAGEVYGLA